MLGRTRKRLTSTYRDKLSSEYESESNTSTGSALPLYTLLFPILLPLSLLSSLILLPLYNIS